MPGMIWRRVTHSDSGARGPSRVRCFSTGSRPRRSGVGHGISNAPSRRDGAVPAAIGSTSMPGREAIGFRSPRSRPRPNGRLRWSRFRWCLRRRRRFVCGSRSSAHRIRRGPCDSTTFASTGWRSRPRGCWRRWGCWCHDFVRDVAADLRMRRADPGATDESNRGLDGARGSDANLPTRGRRTFGPSPLDGSHVARYRSAAAIGPVLSPPRPRATPRSTPRLMVSSLFRRTSRNRRRRRGASSEPRDRGRDRSRPASIRRRPCRGRRCRRPFRGPDWYG